MGITHACFGLSYLFALALELVRQARPGRGVRIAGLLFGIAGLVAQTIFLILRQPNPATAYGSLLLLAWVLAIFYLYGSVHHWSQAWALFVLPVVILLVGISFAMHGDDAGVGSWFSADHFWGTVHGILVLAASVGITVAFLASLMYLVQARRLRMKRNPLGGMRLLSLERLETMSRRAINLAFPLLTAGLLLGVIRVPTSGATAVWTETKIIGTVGLWAVGLLLVYLRYGAHLPPRRLAFLTIAAFGLMLVTLVASHPFAAGEGAQMNLTSVGVSFRTASVEIRERVAFTDADRDLAAAELAARYGCEAAILSTCNRVELYLAKPAGDDLPNSGLLAEFLGEFHGLSASELQAHLIEKKNDDGVRHLFRVAASLDSLIVGEGQIAGQVKAAFEAARAVGSTGPLLNALYQHVQRASKRVRSETGIAEGHVSVSSVAVDYVRGVFDHFGDKTVLVIGAGKMGRLTLKHLRELAPKQVLVANRSPEKAQEVAADCGGKAIEWDRLDDALAEADIVLSTTGSPEPVVSAKRYAAIRHRRARRTTVILDIAVPRDFDPAIHDGETTFLFNIDDLKGVREQTLARRRAHVDKAEAIVTDEARRFVDDWGRRKNGQLIARLTEQFETKRREVLEPLLGRLNGKLTEKDRQDIELAFRLYQNKLLHVPITALGEASREGNGPAFLEAVRRLFRLDG